MRYLFYNIEEKIFPKLSMHVETQSVRGPENKSTRP